MKKLLFLLCIAPLLIHAQDVQFFQGTWEEAKAKAAAEHKMIFVDAYTYWCGPCKMMDKEKFHSNQEVADLLNKNFISYKVECEHDAGIAFSRKYRVNVYPTMLFFNEHGELLEKKLGYNSDQKEFLDIFQKVMSMDQSDTYHMDHQQMVMPWPDFYVKRFKDANDSTWKRDKTVDANAWLATQTDLFSEVSWGVMYLYPLNETYTQYFLDHYDTYKDLYKQEAKDKCSDVMYHYVNRAVDEKNPELFNKALTMVSTYFSENPANVIFLKWDYYMMLGDWSALSSLFEGYRKESPEKININQVNQLAWTFYEQCDDQQILKLALTWFDPYLKDLTDYNALDTYAALLYKTKNYKDAAVWAEKAIQQGKSDKMDVTGTEELLEKIKAEK